MAQQVKVILVDDVDGGPADETLTFGLDGTNYEIDLSSANAARLRGELATWISAGRRVAGKRRGSGGASGDAAKIRAWARDRGMKVPDRGRIPADVRAAYESAT